MGLALALLAARPARAQPGDLEAVSVELPAPVSAFLLFQRLSVPEPSTDALPEAARPAYERWTAARRELDRLHAVHRADGDRPGLAGEIMAAQEALLLAETPLRAALDGELDRLDPAALLVLGWLEHEHAASRYRAELDGLETCLADGRADCVEPRLDETAALAVWSRVDGADVLASHARYQRAVSHEEAGEHERAIALLAQVLRGPAPPELEAAAAARLGLLTHPASARAVADTFGRCAARGLDDLSAACALLAAEALWRIGRDRDALESLLPILDAPSAPDLDVVPMAAELVARDVASARRITAPLVRTRVLDAAAGLLADRGLLTRSIEALEAAEALAPEADRRARIS